MATLRGMPPSPAPPSGSFFAIDRRTWRWVASFGLNPAVAYLTLAAFTGRSNRWSRAGALAVSTHTGLARGRARAALDQLTRLGAVVEECAGSARRASRELVPFHETPVGREAVPEPDRVWLPNALVRAGHLARLRETHDPALLELLVSLYSAENLRDDGGLPRALIARTRPRTRLAHAAGHVVWAWPAVPSHGPATGTIGEAAATLARIDRLAALGLVTWAPHLAEHETDGELLHPLGGGAGGAEHLTGLAHAAARALAPAVVPPSPEEHFALPVAEHIEHAAVVDVVRLALPPRTRPTRAFEAAAARTVARFTTHYTGLAARALRPALRLVVPPAAARPAPRPSTA